MGAVSLHSVHAPLPVHVAQDPSLWHRDVPAKGSLVWIVRCTGSSLSERLLLPVSACCTRPENLASESSCNQPFVLTGAAHRPARQLELLVPVCGALDSVASCNEVRNDHDFER